MKLYLLLFGLFIVQEPISSGGGLLEAYQHHENVWIIHLLYIVATTIDIVVGYYVGKLIQVRLKESKFFLYAKRKADAFTASQGNMSRRIALLLYGPILFPISAFITPWLDIPFSEAFIFLFLGDLLFWYGPEWLVVLGIKSFIPDPTIALYGVLILIIVIMFGVNYFKKKK
jgi:membrane protein YqaA with SNARE-associated domain